MVCLYFFLDYNICVLCNGYEYFDREFLDGLCNGEKEKEGFNKKNVIFKEMF